MAKTSVISVAILGDSKGLSRAFKEAEDASEKFVRNVGGAAVRVADFFIDVGKKVLLAAGIIATALAGLAIKGGLERVLDTEDAIVKFKRLGLSIEEIEALVKGVDQAFDGTVFTNPSGFALASRLIGVGVELDDIQGIVGNIADVAAHSNVPLDVMSDIFEKIIAGGRLTGRELTRLQQHGVPLSDLAGALGLTTAELREMVTAGAITDVMFLDAMQSIEMFDGAAKSAGDTTRGALQNIRSQFARLGELMIAPLFGENGPMVRFFKAVRLAIIDLRPIAKGLGDTLAANMVPVLEKVTDWLGDGGLGRGVERAMEVFGTLSNFISTVAWPAFQSGIEIIGNVIKYVRDQMDEYGPSIKDTIQSVMDKFDSLKEQGGELLAKLEGPWNTIKEIWGEVTDIIKEESKEWKPVFDEIKESVGTLFQKFVDGEVPIRGLITAVVLLIAPFSVFLKELLPLFLPLLEVLLPEIAQMADQILPDLAAAFGEVVEMIMPLVSWVLENLIGLLETFPALVGFAVVAFLSWKTVALGMAVVEGVIRGIAAAQGVLNAIMALNPFVALAMAVIAIAALIYLYWDEIVVFFKWVWDWIKRTASATWDWLKNKVTTIARGIADFFLNWTLVGRIIKHWDAIKEAATGVWTWVSEKFTALVDFFKGVPDLIGAAISGVADALLWPFKEAFNNIARAWNNTLGKFSFKVPDWIPGMGGKGWSFPKIPTFHEGGIFKSPFGEGLALLRDGEIIIPPENVKQMSAMPRIPSGGMGGSSNAPLTQQTIIVELDGKVLASALMDPMAKQIRVRTGTRR